MSMIFKAKKYLASKLSESSGGQTLILRLFGVRGVAVMNGLYNAAARFYGDKMAKQLKLDILKLMLKLVLLYRNNVITAESAAPARPKMLSMMDMIVDTLENDATSTPKSRDKEVKDLASSMQATHDAVMPLLQPNVREHNWMRLTRIFDSYGSHEFLSAFLLDPAYEADREDVLLNFKSLVRPYSAEMSSMKEFLRKQSELRRARIEKMTSQPYSLHSWLEDVQGSVLFQEWLRDNTSPESLHLLLFLRAVDYYRGTNNRSLLSQRAGQVVETYLSPNASQPIQLDDLVRSNVLALADQGNGSRGIFDEAEADATGQLTEIFLAHFPTSTQFQSLLNEIQSIDVRMKRMDKEQIIASDAPAMDAVTEGLDTLELDEIGDDDNETVASTTDTAPPVVPPAAAEEEEAPVTPAEAPTTAAAEEEVAAP